MISVEIIEIGPWGNGNLPAAKITFQGEHFLAAEDVMPLFHWTRDDILVEKTSRTEVVFAHWLDAGAIHRYDPLSRLVSGKKTASLVLAPLEAWVPVESWLVELTDYISAKNPEARINFIEIQGVDSL
jgi:hypothetical protein